MSQHDRQRHQLGRLVAGKPEHHSLVSRAPRVHSHRDVRGLPAHVDLDVNGVGVEIVVPSGVSDAPDRAADHGLEFLPRGPAPRRRLSRDHRAAGGDERFAGDPGQGIPSQERVENGVGNLVRDLVRMAFGHRLRGKEPHVAVLLHAYGTPSSFWGLDGWGETTFAVRLGMRLLEERAMLAARLPRCLGVAGAGGESVKGGGPRPTAVILLAGRSQRTWPLTADFPKPLLPLWGRPLTERVLDQLRGVVDTAVLVVGYQKERILDHFGTRYAGIRLVPVEQENARGTADALRVASAVVRGPVLVLNGDDFYHHDDLARVSEHPTAILCKEASDPWNRATVTVTEDDWLMDVQEKPRRPGPGSSAAWGPIR